MQENVCCKGVWGLQKLLFLCVVPVPYINMISSYLLTFQQIVEELRDCILQLRFPHRVQSKEATPKVKRKVLGSSSPSKSTCLPMAQPPLSDRPCLIVLHKPLEKLLIRYYVWGICTCTLTYIPMGRMLIHRDAVALA